MSDELRLRLGREEPLAELADALRAGAAGSGGLVVVSGEAGIGKTWLAGQAAALAERDGIGVAWTSCWDGAGAPAFWPWGQLWRQIAAAEPQLPAARELAERLLGGTPVVDGADGELARFNLFDAAHRAVRAAAARRPWLLVVDDVQWADGSSLALLDFLARQLVTERVVVIATQRDEPGSPTEQSDPLPAARRVALGGLDAASLARLVELDDQQAAEALHRRTRGNPLFGTELARLARSRGLSVADVDVPSSVRAVLVRRLDVLSEPTRQVMSTAAVLGAEFGLEQLTATVDGPLVDALDEAAAAGLILPSGVHGWAFRHGLVRDVLYAELGVAGRVRRHERVADALVALAAGGAAVEPATLAMHYARAAPAGRASDAVVHSLAAARAARGVAGYREAAEHCRTALALLDLAPSAADRGELLIALADAELDAGDPAAARASCAAAAELARRAGRPDLLAHAALTGSGGMTGFEVPSGDPEQVALLTEARSAVPPGSTDWVRLTARLSVALPWETPAERRRGLAEAAVSAARTTNDPALLAAALAAHCDAIAGPAYAERRLADAEEIISLAAAVGELRGELLGRRLRVVALLERGDYVAADSEISTFARRVESLRQPLYAWYPPLWRAMRAMMTGNLDESDAELAVAEQAGRRAESLNAEMLVVACRWWRLVASGRLEEQRGLITSRVGRMYQNSPDIVISVALAHGLAGDLDKARDGLDRVGREALAAVADSSEWLPMMVQLAELVDVLGGHPIADWAYDALAPHAERHAIEGIGAYSHGILHRHLGKLAARLGRADRARSHFGAALAGNRAAGAPLLVALTERDAERALGGGAGRDRGHSPDLEPDPGPGRPRGVFRRDGELWSLSWAGRTVTAKNSKGMRDLAQLLANPVAEVAALDLAGVAVELRDGDLGELVDAPARAAYRSRLVELDAELAEADANADSARSATAAKERAALLGQLATAYGLSGRVRHGGDPAERARSAVTWRIRDAVRRIEAVHPELGRHLRHSVRTGRFCSYRPEQPVDWQLS